MAAVTASSPFSDPQDSRVSPFCFRPELVREPSNPPRARGALMLPRRGGHPLCCEAAPRLPGRRPLSGCVLGCYLTAPFGSQSPACLPSLWISPSGSPTVWALPGPPASVSGPHGDTADWPPCSSWKAICPSFPFSDLAVNGGFFLRKGTMPYLEHLTMSRVMPCWALLGRARGPEKGRMCILRLRPVLKFNSSCRRGRWALHLVSKNSVL